MKLKKNTTVNDLITMSEVNEVLEKVNRDKPMLQSIICIGIDREGRIGVTGTPIEAGQFVFVLEKVKFDFMKSISCDLEDEEE